MRPSFNIPKEKSQGITVAPDFEKATELVPVPAARSKTNSLFLAETACAVALRQEWVSPNAKTSFVMSYFAATRSNIAATSLGFFVKEAFDIFIFCQPHSFLPLVDGF